MRILSIVFLLLVASSSFAGQYRMDCLGLGYHGKEDGFSIVFSLETELLAVSTSSVSGGPHRSKDMATIDKSSFAFEMKPESQVMLASDIGTHKGYFAGSLKLEWISGLPSPHRSEAWSQSTLVSFDDGDGFGFDDRFYSCIAEYIAEDEG